MIKSLNTWIFALYLTTTLFIPSVLLFNVVFSVAVWPKSSRSSNLGQQFSEENLDSAGPWGEVDNKVCIR